MYSENDDYGFSGAKREKTKKARRLSRSANTNLVFFITHNLISMTLFFVIGNAMGIFDKQTDSISAIFGNYYLDFYITVFFLSLVLGLLARGLAFFIMRVIYITVFNKDIKKFMDLIRGINSITMNYIVLTLLSSFLFTIGALGIIESALFKQYTLMTLIIAYIVMKIGSYAIVKGVEYLISGMLT